MLMLLLISLVGRSRAAACISENSVMRPSGGVGGSICCGMDVRRPKPEEAAPSVTAALRHLQQAVHSIQPHPGAPQPVTAQRSGLNPFGPSTLFFGVQASLSRAERSREPCVEATPIRPVLGYVLWWRAPAGLHEPFAGPDRPKRAG